ncbi:MAG: hypothetical protein K2G37_02620 [Clostridia bacterium]|nr:hypothetical protein [Clostridia bacterium]MDE7329383.1 hypothetical protein [Clostridia bacterium]
MSYSKMTLDYMRRNFLKSMATLFIPAVILGLLLEPLSILEIIVSVGRKDNTYNSFIEIFAKLNGFTSAGRLVLILFALILTIVAVSISSGYNRQRMRYGTESKSLNVGEYFNDHFLPIVKYAIVIFISLELVAILLSTFLYTAIKLFDNTFAACLILAIIFILIELYFVSLTLLCVPNMTMKGYGVLKSLGQSIYMIFSKSAKIFFGILWMMVLLMVPTILIISFPFENMKYVLKIFSCLFYWVMISYLSVMNYVVYFDVEELEREDLKV